MKGAVLLALLLVGTACAGERRGKGATGEKRRVLLELFTSQGCSSCPPAEELLRKLAGRPVVRAAFHVDGWDHLGWKDPHADPRWTRRHHLIARTLGQKTWYTPELVWDGRGHGVPADVPTALEKALARAPVATIAADVVLSEELLVTGTVRGPLRAGLEVEVLVLEDDVATRVTAGENAGKTLDESCVVREVVVAARVAKAVRELPFRAKVPVGTWKRDKVHVAVVLREPAGVVWQALDVALVTS